MSSSEPATPPGPRRVRLHYLPFDEVEVGMVLGEALTLTDRNIVRFALPAGHQLSEQNLLSLASHRAEFVCIAVPDTRSDEQIASDSAAAARRVMRIFEGADLSQPAMAALFERVLAYRSK